jgi:uncharacterized membrane protein YkvA (DUF1232 family)
MKTLKFWKKRAELLENEIYALYLGCKDPRVPWHAKLLIAVVIGYALSPIDLIPDFIPVIGYLDDLVLVPAGISLVLRMIPKEVMAECRKKAAAGFLVRRRKNWIAAAIIIAIWLFLLYLIVKIIWRISHGNNH